MKLDKWIERLGEWVTRHPGEFIIIWVISYPVLVIGLAWLFR